MAKIKFKFANNLLETNRAYDFVNLLHPKTTKNSNNNLELKKIK